MQNSHHETFAISAIDDLIEQAERQQRPLTLWHDTLNPSSLRPPTSHLHGARDGRAPRVLYRDSIVLAILLWSPDGLLAAAKSGRS